MGWVLLAGLGQGEESVGGLQAVDLQPGLVAEALLEGPLQSEAALRTCRFSLRAPSQRPRAHPALLSRSHEPRVKKGPRAAVNTSKVRDGTEVGTAKVRGGTEVNTSKVRGGTKVDTSKVRGGTKVDTSRLRGGTEVKTAVPRGTSIIRRQSRAADTHGLAGRPSHVALSDVQTVVGGVRDVDGVDDVDVVVRQRIVVVGFGFQLDATEFLQLDGAQNGGVHLQGVANRVT